MNYDYRTDIGRRKREANGVNEDSVAAATVGADIGGDEHKIGVFVLADGAGGADAGDVASRYIVEAVISKVTRNIRPATRTDLDSIEPAPDYHDSSPADETSNSEADSRNDESSDDVGSDSETVPEQDRPSAREDDNQANGPEHETGLTQEGGPTDQDQTDDQARDGSTDEASQDAEQSQGEMSDDQSPTHVSKNKVDSELGDEANEAEARDAHDPASDAETDSALTSDSSGDTGEIQDDTENGQDNNDDDDGGLMSKLPFTDGGASEQDDLTHPSADGRRDHPLDQAPTLPSKLRGLLPDETLDFESILSEIIRSVHRDLLDMNSESPDNFYSTVVAGIVCDGWLSYASVGDSRIYISNNKTDTIERLTIDHSKVGKLRRQGEITEVEAKVHPESHKISRAVGAPQIGEDLTVDTRTVRLFADDRILFTSDGLIDAWQPSEGLQQELSYGMTDALADEVTNKAVTDDDIHELLLSADAPNDIAQECISLANEKGGTDNISAIVVTDVSELDTPARYEHRGLKSDEGEIVRDERQNDSTEESSNQQDAEQESGMEATETGADATRRTEDDDAD